MQDGEKRRGGKEKEKEKEEMLMKTSNRKGQFCSPSYATVKEKKECIFLPLLHFKQKLSISFPSLKHCSCIILMFFPDASSAEGKDV